MKKLFLILLLALPLLSAANQTALGGSLTLATLQHVPNPAEPGKDVDVWFNVYASEAQNGISCRVE
ncbi:MAG: hypothetical protein Q8P02_02760, partial [Candidatus Micrarchaeota archaeon]|nr:hypothetical protein [Candidatus Micrarchaeota archaeon]